MDSAEQRVSTLNVCLRIKAQKTNTSATDSTYSVIEDKKSLKVKSWRGEEVFKFSHIFNETSTQQEVYDSTTREAVNTFLQGKDCLIFAYGTTNAGKTYSVQGNPSNPGIVPRAMKAIFSSIKGHIDFKPHIFPGNYASCNIASQKDRHRVEFIKSKILSIGPVRGPYLGVPQLANCSLSFSSALSSTVSADLETTHDADEDLSPQNGWNSSSRCSLWISMIEVYNENVFDLLSMNSPQKITISQDADGKFFPCGNIEVNVNSLEEAKAVIQFGTGQRKKCSTLLNMSSSRSHSVLRLRLVRADRAPLDMVQLGPLSPAAFDVDDSNVSTFLFCDLAGSERVNKAGNTGDRARETANINTSLVVLGRCIDKLRLKGGSGSLSRSAIVPFRDSKLTMILQPLLAYPGQKSLLVNISKSQDLIDETINVLKFSAVARVVVVKDTTKCVPHYQLPRQSRVQQLYESYRARAVLEETRSRSLLEVNRSNQPHDVATQTEITEEIVLVSDSSDEGTPPPKSNSDVNAALVAKCEEYKAKMSDLQNLLAEKDQDWKDREQYLFSSFETLEQGMKDHHAEELENKETQLYTLMQERIDIQKKYFEGLLVSKENDSKILLDQATDELAKAKQELQDQKKRCELHTEEKENLRNTTKQQELTIEQLNMELIVKRDMLDINSGNLQKERAKCNQLDLALASKCKELLNLTSRSSLQMKDNNDEIAKLNLEIEHLQKEVKHLIKDREEIRAQSLKDESSAKKYKMKCTELSETLASTESNLQHLQQVSNYLIDEFRPDLRRSITCAEQEIAWGQIFTELKTIPSQRALLKQENLKLKEELEMKDKDMENFIKRRDAQFSRYEKELKSMSNELDLHKRESQALSAKMMGMTPRKRSQTTTQREFKTPLTPQLHQSAFTPTRDSRDTNILSEGEVSTKKSKSCRKTKNTPAKIALKENMSYRSMPPDSESEPDTPVPKQRNRRKLYNNHHPAMDLQDDEPPVDCEVPQEDLMALTKRRLRSQFKYK